MWWPRGHSASSGPRPRTTPTPKDNGPRPTLTISSIVNDFEEHVNDYKPMHSFTYDDDEQEAITVLQTLWNTTDSKPQRPPIEPSHNGELVPLDNRPNIKKQHMSTYQPRASVAKRIILPFLAFLFSALTLAGTCQCVHYFILPVVWDVTEYGKTIFFGEEEGVQCTVWSISPLQQLRCMMISWTNGYMISLMNDVVRELFSQKWTTFVPTCVGYLFTGGGALYSMYFYGIRRFVLAVCHHVFSLYRAYYLALNNPMMPFDYIEKNMVMVE